MKASLLEYGLLSPRLMCKRPNRSNFEFRRQAACNNDEVIIGQQCFVKSVFNRAIAGSGAIKAHPFSERRRGIGAARC